MDRNIPTKLVINAVFKPESKLPILPSILLTSNPSKPLTIPAKVPNIPRVVNKVGVYWVN
ncbi:hypothetical protein KAM484_35810 [Aeromonas caviae]|nr:hypothetical protein KAM467_34280 [Aeromonas caviae]GKR92776.1 hypothetical protein KAM484_35810 [Aeromonas caviae]